MKLLRHLLLVVFATYVCSGETNSPSRGKAVYLLPELSDSTWRWVSATRVRKPSCVLTLTNDISQGSVLAVTDRVNANHALDGYLDGYCGFGARLSRDYLGGGSLVTVSFAWDRKPKRTIISLYGTNAVTAEAWRRDMTKALREKFGDASVEDRGKK